MRPVLLFVFALSLCGLLRADTIIIEQVDFGMFPHLTAEERQQLRQPVSLHRRDRQVFEGFPVSRDGTTLTLRMLQEAGEILITFPYDEIIRLRFPGNEVIERAVAKEKEGKLDEALGLLEPLLAQRTQLLDLMAVEDRLPFARLPDLALHLDDPGRAIAFIRDLRPYFAKEEGILIEFNGHELLGFHRLGLAEEAAARLDDWFAAKGRFANSALGDYVAASLAMDEGRIELALRRALRPIVFSGQLPVEYLDACYSMAVVCAQLMDNPAHRDQLLEEMRERGLSWRSSRAFAVRERELLGFTIDLGDGPRPAFEAVSPELDRRFEQQGTVAPADEFSPTDLLDSTDNP